MGVMPRAFLHDQETSTFFFFFSSDVFASFGPTFVFQLFSLRTLCLRHDSKLRFLFVTTLLHIFSGICWSWSAILPPSNINCLLYWYYLRSSRKYSSLTPLYAMLYQSLRIFISQVSSFMRCNKK